ncbi:MAG: hypothetical protein GC160_02750 [Acidobacteria bacterium]|nr:hypothetical protein [Acidobacteriota bacterium]
MEIVKFPRPVQPISLADTDTVFALRANKIRNDEIYRRKCKAVMEAVDAGAIPEGDVDIKVTIVKDDDGCEFRRLYFDGTLMYEELVGSTQRVERRRV